MVKMPTLKQQKIDDFLNQIEIVADLRYQINKETEYCNHTYVVKTLLPKYQEAKENFKQTIEKLLDNNYTP